jgi:predicted nucleic acid-binding protein
MREDILLDINILIYASLPQEARHSVAATVLAEGGVISVQVLNEFVHVARRKFKRPWAEVRQALSSMSDLLHPPLSISRSTHLLALVTAERHGLSFFDALIVASALEAGCTTLLSEDMQSGRVIDGRLTIRNPFTAGSPP